MVWLDSVGRTCAVGALRTTRFSSRPEPASPGWGGAQDAEGRRAMMPPRGGRTAAWRTVTWLILPVVICLSQRLSHACLSINCLYCETANGSLNQL